MGAEGLSYSVNFLNTSFLHNQMSTYKEPSILGRDAMRRGIDSGREKVTTFRQFMEAGRSLDDFLIAIGEDTSGQWG